MPPYCSNYLAGTEFLSTYTLTASIATSSLPACLPLPLYADYSLLNLSYRTLPSISSARVPPFPASTFSSSITPHFYLIFPSPSHSTSTLPLRHSDSGPFPLRPTILAIIPGLDSHRLLRSLSERKRFAPNIASTEMIRLTPFRPVSWPYTTFPCDSARPLQKPC